MATKNFAGFDEVHTSSPSGHLDLTAQQLLPSPLQLSLCREGCLPFISPILSSKPNSFDPLHLTPPSDSSPQACTGPDPIAGTYVSASIPSVLYPPAVLPFSKATLTAGLYDFVPSDCTFQHDGLRFHDHSSCLRQERGVFFTGDSHARAMYDVLLHRFEGNDSILQLSAKMPEKSARLQNLRLVSSLLRDCNSEKSH